MLGPLLFLLYVNDIINCTEKKFKTRLFVDDTNIFISADTAIELKTQMRKALNDVFNWCRNNMLTINADKHCYTLFKGRKNIYHITLTVLHWENL